VRLRGPAAQRNDGNAAEALRCGEAALAAHEKTFGENHPWTKDSARVVADARAALARAEEAAAPRQRTSPQA
jgi:hypothetical protein